MISIKDKSKCCGCHACFNICPKNAIEMKEDEKGFKYPVVDEEKCIDCGICEKICPILNKSKEKIKPLAYACYNKNEKIRLESTSGGIFTIIAEYILDNNGCVFGAAFNDNFLVSHIKIERKEDLYKLRTSKYLQSNIGNTYKEAKELLESEKKVLFTGTPCQINGLRSYLNKEYDNLYTQDIICHGVPSPKVWEKYLEYREKKDSGQIQKVNFRQKDNGWSSYEILIKYNENEYRKDHNDDIYMNAFLRDASLRDSCYSCSSKGYNRRADITLADFWGINNILPEMNDEKGTSLIMINTKKGNELFKHIADKMVYREVEFDEAIQYNPSYYNSADKPAFRKEFFENLGKLYFEDLIEKYTIKHKKITLKNRVIRKFKRILKKVKKQLIK